MARVVARSALRLLCSRRTAIGAMLVMATMLGLASLVPDPELRGRVDDLRASGPILAWIAQHLKPAQVARSPLFLALPGYVFAGISLSIVQRVRAHRTRARRLAEGGEERFRIEREFTLGRDGRDAGARVAALIRRARYEVVAQGPAFVRGRRGAPGFFGSIAFHLGLLFVLVGVTVSGLTRVRGEILLTEGFPVPFAAASMLTLSGPGTLSGVTGEALSIRDFVADYSAVGTPVDFSLLLSVQRGGERLAEREVRVNQAFRWRGFQITLHRYGFAPELVAWDASGAQRQHAVGVLQLLPPGRWDALPLEGGGQLAVRLFPDFATLEGRPVTRSLQPARPVVDFEWRDPAGSLVAQGRVERGRRTEVRGYAVAFPALSYWGGFVVARDRGLPFFVLGSALASLGLLVRLAFPDQTIRVEWDPALDPAPARARASTRFFPAAHELEVERLVRSLEEGRP